MILIDQNLDETYHFIFIFTAPLPQGRPFLRKIDLPSSVANFIGIVFFTACTFLGEDMATQLLLFSSVPILFFRESS